LHIACIARIADRNGFDCGGMGLVRGSTENKGDDDAEPASATRCENSSEQVSYAEGVADRSPG
jgi:hypothetical protein